MRCRDLPTSTQKVKVTPIGARRLGTKVPVPMVGYSRPKVYPRPDSELSTGFRAPKGGAALAECRALKRASSAEMEPCCASSATCSPGFCIVDGEGRSETALAKKLE
eukprot:CAMPEP_0181445240 /NCGR_PEP_ID=MMETSP1110-20121109/25484_1 /TAXON_ID=174948 /ORGANISM="Symbiodinium sp., Strain CCMP421" /LENGTH=106 /DNA_ID=CAMNT_0023569275 /DNA_START=134 /DNA_END=452 /DNA_ORIENTATION=-